MGRDTPKSALPGQFPRLSDRFQVDGMSLTWIVPNNRKLFGKKTAAIEMQIIDLSIAGALLVGPSIDVVRSGSRVPFLFQGAQGVTEIRHIRSSDSIPDLDNGAYYGVVFITLPNELKERIFEHTARRGRHTDPELADLWNHAR